VGQAATNLATPRSQTQHIQFCPTLANFRIKFVYVSVSLAGTGPLNRNHAIFPIVSLLHHRFLDRGPED